MSTVPHRMVLYRWIKYNYNVSGVIIHRKNYQDCANRVTFDEICKLAAIGYIIVNSIKASSFKVSTYQKLSCLDCLQRAKFSFDEGKKGSIGRLRQCFKLSLVSFSIFSRSFRFAEIIQKRQKKSRFQIYDVFQ